MLLQKLGDFKKRCITQRVSNETLHFNQHGSVLDLARDSWDKFILEKCQKLKTEGGGAGRCKKTTWTKDKLGVLVQDQEPDEAENQTLSQLLGQGYLFSTLMNLAWWYFFSTSSRCWGISGRCRALSAMVHCMVLNKYQFFTPGAE